MNLGRSLIDLGAGVLVACRSRAAGAALGRRSPHGKQRRARLRLRCRRGRDAAGSGRLARLLCGLSRVFPKVVEDGYFTELAELGPSGWRFRDAHWSVVTAPSAAP